MTEKNHLRVAVKASHLAAAAQFVSSEVTRYYLHGVCIEKRSDSGVTLIGCDGAMLGVVHDADGFAEWSGTAETKILQTPPAVLKECTKRRRITGETWVVYDPTTIYVVEAGGHRDDAFAAVDCRMGELIHHTHVGQPLIDGTFPMWRSAMPLRTLEIQTAKGPTRRDVTTGFNSSLPAKFGTAVRCLTGTREPHITITTNILGGAMLVTASEAPDFVGLLMPSRNAESFDAQIDKVARICDREPRRVEEAAAAE
jgi:hypothetical protein